ncbi:MAG: hypothetical protein ACWGN7_03675 [Thermodesulfovibrionales bacterium]
MRILDRICRFFTLGGLVNSHAGRIRALSYDETVGFEAFNARCLAERHREDDRGLGNADGAPRSDHIKKDGS